MHEWWLLGCLIGLALLAMGIVSFPLRQSRWLLLILVMGLMMAVGVGYWQWGAWPAWQHYKQSIREQARAQVLLKSMPNSQVLIDKLRAKLDETPQSAHGWYLLGRLYSGERQWTNARDAFAVSHELNPVDEQTTVNYAYALWEVNHQSFNHPIHDLFNRVLEKNPNQPDALAMLAMEAYQAKDNQRAIRYWQHLLSLLPSQSEEADAIRRAIAKAQK